MFCKNCGSESDARNVACMNCGCDPRVGGKFCENCGAEVGEGQIVCVKCGRSLMDSAAGRSKKSRVVYILLAILPSLPCCCQIPFHNFYLGRTNLAIVQTLLWISAVILAFMTGGASALITWGLTMVWYIVEACLVKTDPSGAKLK